MNIIVRTASGRIHVRPDNTLDRYSRDFYVPDGIGLVSLSPVIFARITRPGKCIGRKFTGRYYEDCGAGVLLYPEDLALEGPEGFAEAIRLDQSSSLSDASVGNLGGILQVTAGGVPIYEGTAEASVLLSDAVAEVSVLTLVRTGDLVAVELAPRITVWERGRGDVEIRAESEEKEFIHFAIR